VQWGQIKCRSENVQCTKRLITMISARSALECGINLVPRSERGTSFAFLERTQQNAPFPLFIPLMTNLFGNVRQIYFSSATFFSVSIDTSTGGTGTNIQE